MAKRFDILDYIDGTFGVLLDDYDPAVDEFATAADFNTREEAEAFIAGAGRRSLSDDGLGVVAVREACSPTTGE